MSTDAKSINHSRSSREKKYLFWGLAFASPWIIGFIVFTLYPIIASMYYSVCDYSILSKPVFIGLKNYKDMFANELFRKSLYNTIYITVIGTPLNLAFALLIAVLLNMKVRGLAIFRTIYYLPTIIPVVATSILWKWMLNSEYGLVNYILGIIGLPQPGWLTDPAWSKPALILMGLWGTGSYMVIYLAALQGVPESLYEAADLDGASAFRKFWNITLPVISPITLFQFIMGIINSFQYFTQAFIFSFSGNWRIDGGPENSILFYAVELYRKAFVDFKMGYASAMAWVLFVITAAITIIIFKTSYKWVYYSGEGD